MRCSGYEAETPHSQRHQDQDGQDGDFMAKKYLKSHGKSAVTDDEFNSFLYKGKPLPSSKYGFFISKSFLLRRVRADSKALAAAGDRNKKLSEAEEKTDIMCQKAMDLSRNTAKVLGLYM